MRRADPGPMVLWRHGDALLAVDLDAVDEVVSVDGDGRARTRDGLLPTVTPPGLEPSQAPRHAVVVRRGHGAADRMALAADDVEGVVEPGDASSVDPPAWLAGLASGHVPSLVRLADQRVAALLEVTALFQRS